MTEPQARPRWPYFGRTQKLLLGCGFAMWIGSYLPWVILRPLGLYNRAAPLVVAWVLWAGLMTLGGAVAPWRLVALTSAAGGGGTAAYFAGWQLFRVMRLCTLSALVHFDCIPGPGLLVTFAAGTYALWQGWRIIRPAPGDL